MAMPRIAYQRTWRKVSCAWTVPTTPRGTTARCARLASMKIPHFSSLTLISALLVVVIVLG
jgi:hypothetical protein